jgi:predicted phosphate transport protein (TIGR00153 family)
MRIFKKEKAVAELIFRHIDKTAECVEATMSDVLAYVTGGSANTHETAALVNSLESEADSLLRDIRELLYSGAYLPQIRGDIYRLMTSIDNVSNKAEDCFDLFHYQNPGIPEQFVADFESILGLTTECFAAFQKAAKAYFGPKDKLEKVRKHSTRVSELESQIDAIERELTERIFSSSLELGEKLHLQQSVSKLVAISDAVEDAADRLQWVSVKSVI